VSFEGLEAHVFEDDRARGPRRPRRIPSRTPAFAGARVLVVNRNFGCGSSREHAPQALQRWGIAAVVGESFSEIFFGNALAIGLPCVTASAADVEALMTCIEQAPETVVTVDLVALSVTAGDLRVDAAMPGAAREALVTGLWDGTGLLLENFDEVRAVAARLPYVGWQARG
jgi:3-isopropylmalate/(R)-2-methylmalate dehydratase small subunit